MSGCADVHPNRYYRQQPTRNPLLFRTKSDADWPTVDCQQFCQTARPKRTMISNATP